MKDLSLFSPPPFSSCSVSHQTFTRGSWFDKRVETAQLRFEFEMHPSDAAEVILAFPPRNVHGLGAEPHLKRLWSRLKLYLL